MQSPKGIYVPEIEGELHDLPLEIASAYVWFG